MGVVFVNKTRWLMTVVGVLTEKNRVVSQKLV